jgi:EAL domain-containing protein (putative c-di-GMP-specific phosphodiesterase class I)
VLEESNVEAKNILLEITESSLLKNHETVEKILNNLNKKGVKLAIDDFGTGFSSLSYLTKFPVDFIKIDKSFIKDIETQPENVDTVEKKLIKAMIGLAHSIDLICVAEGVEVASQFKYLSSVGCDYMQGYHLGKPLSANEITALLKGDI